MNKPDFWPTRSSDQLRDQCYDPAKSVIGGLPLEVRGYPDLKRERESGPGYHLDEVIRPNESK